MPGAATHSLVRRLGIVHSRQGELGRERCPCDCWWYKAAFSGKAWAGKRAGAQAEDADAARQVRDASRAAWPPPRVSLRHAAQRGGRKSGAAPPSRARFPLDPSSRRAGTWPPRGVWSATAQALLHAARPAPLLHAARRRRTAQVWPVRHQAPTASIIDRELEVTASLSIIISGC